MVGADLGSDFSRSSSWLVLCPIMFALVSCVSVSIICICSDTCNISVSGLLVVRGWQVWLCLPVVSFDLEEAEAPSAVAVCAT